MSVAQLPQTIGHNWQLDLHMAAGRTPWTNVVHNQACDQQDTRKLINSKYCTGFTLMLIPWNFHSAMQCTSVLICDGKCKTTATMQAWKLFNKRICLHVTLAGIVSARSRLKSVAQVHNAAACLARWTVLSNIYWISIKPAFNCPLKKKDIEVGLYQCLGRSL